MSKKINVVSGDKYGQLEIVCEVSPKIYSGYKFRTFKCKCSCGNIKEIALSSLRSGQTTSCGCARDAARTKHGLASSPTYPVWTGMIDRCTNKNNKSYKRYGGRGIAVCEEWMDGPVKFDAWAKVNGYKKGLQLDRKDNEKGYSPENCRFVSSKTNNQNTRRSYRWLCEGVVYKSALDASLVIGVHEDTIRQRCKSANFPDYIREKLYTNSLEVLLPKKQGTDFLDEYNEQKQVSA